MHTSWMFEYFPWKSMVIKLTLIITHIQHAYTLYSVSNTLCLLTLMLMFRICVCVSKMSTFFFSSRVYRGNSQWINCKQLCTQCLHWIIQIREGHKFHGAIPILQVLSIRLWMMNDWTYFVGSVQHHSIRHLKLHFLKDKCVLDLMHQLRNLHQLRNYCWHDQLKRFKKHILHKN